MTPAVLTRWCIWKQKTREHVACCSQLSQDCYSGLIHAHGYSSQGKDRKRVTHYTYTHDEPHRHWQPDGQGGWVLNLDSFVAEVTRGAYLFFRDLEQPASSDVRNLVIENAKRIVYIRNAVGVVAAPKRFADIPNLDEPTQKALALFDTGLPDEVVLIKAIRAIYPPKAPVPSSSPNISPSGISLFDVTNTDTSGGKTNWSV